MISSYLRSLLSLIVALLFVVSCAPRDKEYYQNKYKTLPYDEIQGIISFDPFTLTMKGNVESFAERIGLPKSVKNNKSKKYIKLRKGISNVIYHQNSNIIRLGIMRAIDDQLCFSKMLIPSQFSDWAKNRINIRTDYECYLIFNKNYGYGPFCCGLLNEEFIHSHEFQIQSHNVTGTTGVFGNASNRQLVHAIAEAASYSCAKKHNTKSCSDAQWREFSLEDKGLYPVLEAETKWAELVEQRAKEKRDNSSVARVADGLGKLLAGAYLGAVAYANIVVHLFCDGDVGCLVEGEGGASTSSGKAANITLRFRTRSEGHIQFSGAKILLRMINEETGKSFETDAAKHLFDSSGTLRMSITPGRYTVEIRVDGLSNIKSDFVRFEGNEFGSGDYVCEAGRTFWDDAKLNCQRQ